MTALGTGNGESGVYRLVYMSTSLIPPLDDGGEIEIQRILAAAQRANTSRGLTGALTYNDFHFAQALEGRRPDVEAVFAGIRRDWRHREIVVLEEEWVPRRDFPDWSMAFVGDKRVVRTISPNSRLGEIAARPHGSAMALLEMMKFFLLADYPYD